MARLHRTIKAASEAAQRSSQWLELRRKNHSSAPKQGRHREWVWDARTHQVRVAGVCLDHTLTYPPSLQEEKRRTQECFERERQRGTAAEGDPRWNAESSAALILRPPLLETSRARIIPPVGHRHSRAAAGKQPSDSRSRTELTAESQSSPQSHRAVNLSV
ncbi:hypothetical protein SKAU_G00005490 [Synaphobranchus kaupii]|uniref:Uncharacterized protein n=1 Tax=Synaphobranchus kaupii TaxID=118154 RepID=A0A9Q1G916_SYNKA|nr:hypothetical protein SKAU_G00005490 [Synaphobranchus kaupii]